MSNFVIDPATTGKFTIGGVTRPSGGNFAKVGNTMLNGILDQVHILSGAMTQSQINTLYNSYSGRTYGSFSDSDHVSLSTVAWYDFDKFPTVASPDQVVVSATSTTPSTSRLALQVVHLLNGKISIELML